MESIPVTLILTIAAAIAAVGAAIAAVVVGLRVARRRKTVLVERVDASLLDGAYREAADRAVAALAARPDPGIATELRRRHARALVGLEEYAAAERVCREAAEAAPGARERGLAIVELVRCLAAAGEFDRAFAELDRAGDLSAWPDARAARELAAADLALARLRFDEAERALAVVYEPSDVSAHAGEAALGHARLQYLRGNFNQAIAEVNRVLERLKGEDLQALALVTLGRALLDQERPAPLEADQAISSALVLVRYPGYAAVAAGCQALVQAIFDNEREALEAARRAPKLTVSKRYLAEAHCLAGDALRRLGRAAEARVSYQTALGLDAGSLEALWGLGKCAEEAGLAGVADTYFQLCLEAAPEHFLGRRSEDAI